MTRCSARRGRSDPAPAEFAGSSTRSTAPPTTSSAFLPTPCRWPPSAAGEIMVGVVVDPSRGETWTAVGAGRGVSGPAQIGGRPLPATAGRCCSPAHGPLATSLVATGFSYLPERRARQAAVLATVLPAVRDIRRFGSAALDLCWVAAGRFDAFYEWGLAPWDRAAGVAHRDRSRRGARPSSRTARSSPPRPACSARCAPSWREPASASAPAGGCRRRVVAVRCPGPCGSAGP